MMTSLGTNIVLLLSFIKGGTAAVYMYNCPKSQDSKIYSMSKNNIEVTPKSIDPKETELLSNYNFIYAMTYHEKGVEKIENIEQFLVKEPFAHLSIPPNKLKMHTNYKIVVKHEAKKGYNGPKYILPNPSENCIIKMRQPLPIAIISKGAYRTVPPSSITVTAKESYNTNKKNRQGLTYTWTCTQKNKNDFCNKNKVSTEDTLVIPAKFAKNGEEFTVNVKVTEKGIPYGSEAKQTIKVIAKTAEIEIRCTDNCISQVRGSNFRKKTILKVSCIENCKGIKEKGYYWTVKAANFDYSKTGGRTGSQFVINGNAVRPGHYDVEVKLASKRAVNVLTLNYIPAPNIKDCKTIPQNGVAYQTQFKVTCTNLEKWDNSHTFELSFKDKELERLLGSGIWQGSWSGKLPASKDKQYFISFYREGVTSTDLSIKVGKIRGENEKDEDVVGDDLKFLKKDFFEMISSNDPDVRKEATVMLFATIDRLNKTVTDPVMIKLIDELKYTIPQNVLQMPLTSLKEAADAVVSIIKVENIETNNKDPQMSKLVSTACRKVGDKAFAMVEKQKDDPNTKSLATTLNEALNECLENTVKPNYNALHKHDIQVMTPPPNVDVVDIVEHYDDYIDHDKEHYKLLEDLKETTFNMVNGTVLATKMRALTVVRGEGAVTFNTSSSTTVIIKDIGEELVRTPAESLGIRVVASQDFANDTHSYDLLLTSWSIDLTWWNPAFTKVATDMISLQFWHSTCKERVTDFKKPVNIFFTQQTKSFIEEISDISFNIPKGYGSMTNDELNYHIQVHRIALKKELMLSVKFHDLGAADNFQAVFTVNKFPATEDFTNSVTIRQNNSTMTFESTQSNVTFIYVGIMAKKENAVEGKTLTYHISSVLNLCIKWIVVTSKWEPLCKLKEVNHTGNNTILHCQCWNLSVIAGYIQNIKSYHQEVIKPEIKMELQECSVIFYTLLVTLIVYLILLIISIINRKEPIYFLADNKAQDLFAYLITVKTGWGRNSGTSSNIMIKVFGSKNHSEVGIVRRRSNIIKCFDSQPHVLNYPDPKMRMLQRFGNEKFLLTTKNHLGNLEKIELWFDSIGQNPYWFCRSVIIYDMQLHKEWLFNVKRKLSLKGDDQFITVEPEPMVVQPNEKETPNEGKRGITQRWFHRRPSRVDSGIRNYTFMRSTHNWYFWKLEEHCSYFKKITLVFSNILTVYYTAALFVEQPKMHLNDGFDPYYTRSFGIKEFLYSAASGLPPFTIHLAIGWIFRFSKLQFSEENQDKYWPFFCTALCWAFVICIIVASFTYLMIMGFWIPCYSSLVWLQIAWFGILMGVFVYESIFGCVQTIFCKVNRENMMQKKFATIWKTIDIQRRYLYARFGQELLRPYFQHLYAPLKRRAIKAKRHLMIIRLSVIAEFEDLFMCGVYLIILYLVILADKDSKVFYGYANMVAMLEGKHLRTVSLDDVTSVAKLYAYINETLIPTIQPTHWYGNYVISEPGLMIDLSTKYLGVLRLRQQRIHRIRHYCEIKDVMRFLNMTCWPEFNMKYTETGKYGYRWGEFTANMVYDRMRAMWEYSTSDQTKTRPYLGAIAIYSGGGYVAYLGRTLYNSYANFKKIVENFWIDTESKVFFVEFLAYNINYNIFDAVRLTFEQSSTDYFQAGITVYTARMLMVESIKERLTMVFFYLFVLWVALLLFKSSVGAIKHMRSFFTNIWMLIDTFIIIMSVICIILFGLRFTAIDSYLETLEDVRNNEFVSYFHLFHIEDFLTVAAALLVCVSTVRLWKFLRFSRMFRSMERTLMITAKVYINFFVAYTVVLTATSITLLLLIGNQFYRCHTLLKMMRLMATFPLRAIEFQATDVLPFHTAVLYLVLYSIFAQMSIIMLTMLVVFAYSEAQRQFSGKQDVYTVQDYLIERFFYFTKLCRYKCIRLKSGQTDIDVKVEPKRDKFLYKNSYMVRTRRMILMELLTHCLIRKKLIKLSEFSQYDRNLILLICRRNLIKTSDYDDVEVFFKGRVAGKRFEFIDEKHLDLISNVVNLMLQDNEVVFEKREKNEALDEVLDKCNKVIKEEQEALNRCKLKMSLLYHKITTAGVQINQLHL